MRRELRESKALLKQQEHFITVQDAKLESHRTMMSTRNQQTMAHYNELEGQRNTIAQQAEAMKQKDEQLQAQQAEIERQKQAVRRSHKLLTDKEVECHVKDAVTLLMLSRSTGASAPGKHTLTQTTAAPFALTITLSRIAGIACRGAAEAGRAAIVDAAAAAARTGEGDSTEPRLATAGAWLDTKVPLPDDYKHTKLTEQRLSPHQQRRVQGLTVVVDWEDMAEDAVAIRLRMVGDVIAPGTP